MREHELKNRLRQTSGRKKCYSLLLLLELELRQFLGDVHSVFLGLNGVVDVGNFTFFVYVDRNATRETSCVEYAKGLGIFLVRVAENWVIQFERFGKILVAFWRVYAGSEVADVVFAKRLAILTE